MLNWSAAPDPVPNSAPQLLCVAPQADVLISFGAVRGSTTEDTERPLRGNAEELRSRGVEVRFEGHETGLKKVV